MPVMMKHVSNLHFLELCLSLLLACYIAPSTLTEAFALSSTRTSMLHRSTVNQSFHKSHQVSIRTTSLLYSSKDDKASSQNDFFEDTANQGAKQVAAMSIEERTKRAMLAEAVEDRIIVLYDDLELLLGKDGMPSNVENRDEVQVLAKEIQSLRREYVALVNGGPSPMLNSIDGTGGKE